MLGAVIVLPVVSLPSTAMEPRLDVSPASANRGCADSVTVRAVPCKPRTWLILLPDEYKYVIPYPAFPLPNSCTPVPAPVLSPNVPEVPIIPTFVVSVAVNVGKLVIVTFGVVPPEDDKLPEAVTDVTVPVPHAAEALLSNPAVEACTHLPDVRALSVTLPAVTLPVKVGAFVILTLGVGPAVTVMFPVPVAPPKHDVVPEDSSPPVLA